MCLIAVLVTAGCGGNGAGVTNTAACSLDFEATVHFGPSAGRSFSGRLDVQLESSGELSGTLTQPDGVQLPVSGQANGRALNLLFDLGNSGYVFGAGTTQFNLDDCRGVGGGPFSGPLPGDIGDWGFALGG
jgi:hypothetical protein